MRRFAAGIFLSGALVALCSTALADEWPPISKDELALADDPVNPGAAAVILHRDVVRDDTQGTESEYWRIKILTDAGKKYGDIEITYLEKIARIESIRARTIRPDGTTAEFQGQILDRTALKAKKASVQIGRAHV